MNATTCIPPLHGVYRENFILFPQNMLYVTQLNLVIQLLQY